MNDKEAGAWPGPAVLRVMPPTPVYDHQSMRETGRPRPHILNPATLLRTLCGKAPDFWRLQATPAAAFDFAEYEVHGCANCAKAAWKLVSEQGNGPGGRTPGPGAVTGDG
jgi:hypothetical protein